MCFMVVSVTPAQYFSRKRGLANGIVYAAGGLGGTIITFALNGLISRLGTAWTYRVIGFITLATGLPSAYPIKERTRITAAPFIDRSLLRDKQFILLFFAGALAIFPLFVPPFFLPLYANSLGLSKSAGAGLVAGFKSSSAVGRLLLGLTADFTGPLNTLLVSMVVSGISMLVIWPISTSLSPLIAFVIINGIANGGFFAVMPTVVGAVFGSRRVSVAMVMIGKTCPLVIVITCFHLPYYSDRLDRGVSHGRSNCRIHACCIWAERWWPDKSGCLPPCHFLCWVNVISSVGVGCVCEVQQ